MIPRSTHTAHRHAFGPGKKRSEAVKALHIAESILLHEIEGNPRSLAEHYGIDPQSPTGQLVLALLRALRQQEAA